MDKVKEFPSLGAGWDPEDYLLPQGPVTHSDSSRAQAPTLLRCPLLTHLLLLQQQTRAQRACHLLTYLRVNVLIGLLVVGAISAIFWATKYSQDNKEVPGD